MTTTPGIVLTDTPEPDDRAPIAAGILAFNDPKFGPADVRPLAVLLKGDAGATIGGLWGRTVYGWLYVELLFVPEALRGRGLGRELMRRAEDEARSRGCLGAWIDTFDDGARALYESLGYERFGELDGQPRGGRRSFYSKSPLQDRTIADPPAQAPRRAGQSAGIQNRAVASFLSNVVASGPQPFVRGRGGPIDPSDSA